METINLQSIKSSSIKAVFHAIVSTERITRAEISQKTGLSLMTVGKIADAFTKLEITKEEKDTSNAVGRKASVLCVTDNYYAILLDLTDNRFLCELVDLSCNVIDRFSYAYSDDFYYEENMILFLKNLNLYLRMRAIPENCIGIGVCISGTYDEDTSTLLCPATPELNTMDLKGMIRDALKDYATVLRIEPRLHSAAFFSTSRTENAHRKCILHCLISDTVEYAVVVNGQLLQGLRKRAGDAGDIKLNDGRTFREKAPPSASAERVAGISAEVIAELIRLLDPHTIFVECHRPDALALLALLKKAIAEVKTFTQEPAPELSFSEGDIRASHAGLLLQLRREWLDKIITRAI